MFVGLSSEELDALGLTKAEDYFYLSQGFSPFVDSTVYVW